MTCKIRHASILDLARDERGTAYIELAMVVPVLLLLLLGSIDMSRLISTRIDLEQAAQRTTDYALSARPTNDETAYLVAEAANASGIAAENISAEIYLVCNGVRTVDFSGGCGGGQTRARYVSISIQDQVEPFFNWAALEGLLGSNSFSATFTVVGDSTVRFQ